MVLKNWQKLQRVFVFNILFFFGAISVSSACARVENINLFVAASLVDVMESIGQGFARQYNCVDVRIIPGASSILSRQIIFGAPADVFISADLFNAKLVAEEFNLVSKAMFGNRLAIIAAEDFQGEVKIEQIADFLGVGSTERERLAIGDPDHVPAGIYAKQALIAAGEWARLESRLAPAGDVRAAAAFVARGAALLGIVYVSDANFTGLRIVGKIGEELHEPIKYWGVLLNKKNDMASVLFDYIGGEFAQNLLVEAGFTIMVAE